jgi:hypothetical protein
MKVNEVVLESTDTYLRSLSDRLSLLTIPDALAKGFQNSRIREEASQWLDKWNSTLSQLKKLPSQSTLTSILQQQVFQDMDVAPNIEADKAIQQLVDLIRTKQTTSNIALKYMTKLMTLSLLKPAEEEKQIIDYGDYLPNEMLQAGKIVPVKYVIVNDGTVWVKFNGDWYKDTDDSELQVRLHNTPAENIGKLESMRGRDVPMRVGQTGSRTLEFLHNSETEDWFNEYE